MQCTICQHSDNCRMRLYIHKPRAKLQFPALNVYQIKMYQTILGSVFPLELWSSENYA